MDAKVIQQWLDLLCQSVAELQAGVFLPIKDFSSAANLRYKWPSALNDTAWLNELIKIYLLNPKQINPQQIIQTKQADYEVVGMPIAVNSTVLGILFIKSNPLQSKQKEFIFHFIKQANAWLAFADSNSAQSSELYVSILGVLVSCFEQDSYQKLLRRLVSVLTVSVSCHRVAIAEYQENRSQIVAISNSLHFDSRLNLMQKISNAMDEAIDQDAIIRFPSYETDSIVTRIHQELCKMFGSGSILTIPLVADKRVVGAVTFMRDEEKPFERESVQRCEMLLSLLTPFLLLKKAEEEPITKKALTKLKAQMAHWFGVKNLASKIIALSLMSAIGLTALIKTDFRVTANAVLEGKTQRIIAAPVAGFLVSASARAGDTVHKGDAMASLDDADLQLELSKLDGELQKIRREYREALSANDLVKVRVSSAQINQISSQLELKQRQLKQIALVAPYDGVVIEGDLTQLLGSPIERGDTLFKISPLEGYRIILKIPEKSISYIALGQKGSLALTSVPDKKFDITVQKITAVAKTEDGDTIFRVEANLGNAPDSLRPGMEGISKITVGKASVLWQISHETLDWLRLWAWTWLL